MLRTLTLVAVLGAALALSAPAGAVVFGGPDGENHPNVGALLAPQAYSDGTWASCSGTLISPTVFLTAAHCDWDVARLAVTFASDYDAATDQEYWGTWHADPAYNQRASNPHDIAVLVLDAPVVGIEPADLPSAGSLGKLRRGTKFTSVGYGAQAVTNGPGGKTYHYADVRYAGVGSLNSVTKSWLHISGNRPRATPVRATETRAARTSSAEAQPRRTSSRPRRSRATRSAALRT
jgi:hypothetical protein